MARVNASVSVIIAAKDAAATIATAINSARAQPEVAQIVVVDDGSSDETSAVASAAGGDSVTVLRLEKNYGPSHARNRALDVCTGDFVAVLDADDFFLEGRFADLLSHEYWDVIADNIAFVPKGLANPVFARGNEYAAVQIGFADFILGNLTRPNMSRGELGFLKPVIRRAILDRHNLRYDEALRLGEDYELYARLLAAGAHFKITKSVGYGALIRGNSLSARHAAEDLRNLADADIALMQLPGLAEDGKAALSKHEQQTRDRFRLRHYLDHKRQRGTAATVARLAFDPLAWWPVAAGYVGDKLRSMSTGKSVDEVRYLFPLDGD